MFMTVYKSSSFNDYRDNDGTSSIKTAESSQ
jgi:hypothetical protein